MLLNFQKAAVRGGPRMRLTRQEARQRRARMKPDPRVDYPRETGGNRPWPQVLNVDPETGIGDVRHLLKATGARPWQLDSPGARVLGSKKIARYLNLSEDQLNDRVLRDRTYRTHIRRVSWLLVSDVQSLSDLDERRRERLTRVRRAAAKKRRPPGARG